MTKAVLDDEHTLGEADVGKSRKPISRRDRETLRRLIRGRSETELDDLISQERDQLAAPGRLGAPRIPKFRQAYLVALYYIRYCHKPCSVRAAAIDIDRVIEFSFLRPGKKPKYRKHKSVKALEEDLRSGLRDDDLTTIAMILHGLIWCRQDHVNPTWGWGGAGGGVRPINVRIVPKQLSNFIRWIDALIATKK